MKVRVPDLSTWEHSPLFNTDFKNDTNSLEFERFCQLQLQQIAESLPAVYIRLVYCLPGCEQQRSVYWCAAILPHEAIQGGHESLSEDWWLHSIPRLQLSQLPLGDETSVYIYPFHLSSDSPDTEYLLLKTYISLSVAQQRTIEQQVQCLHQYLILFQECYRQRARVEQLEQTIQRTHHQLRKPLALIELYAELLTARLANSTDEETRSQISLIHEATKELNQDLKNFTTQNQQPALQVDWCDLRGILATSLKGLQPWITEKQLHIQSSSTAAVVKVDAWQLKQAFDNLLSNAIHFSPHNSTIGCHWQVFRHEVLVEIWDEGPGLSDVDLKQAFTPFYTRRPGGTGLGLAIARKIILDHQGRLWVNNLPLKGAKFSFSLPRQPY